MATEQELIELYNDANGRLKAAEKGVASLKEERGESAKQLYAIHGKGHLYDLGDGVEMLLLCSKTGTCYFTPKDKWTKKKGKKPKKRIDGKAARVIEVSAELKPAASVEAIPLDSVPDELFSVADANKELYAGLAVPKELLANTVEGVAVKEIMVPSDTAGGEAVPYLVAAEPEAAPEPEPTPEPEPEELDPLEAALAALEEAP